MRRALATYKLGEAGRAYVRGHLEAGNALCCSLLDVMWAAPGEVSTFAPIDTSVDRLYKFAVGGLLEENVETTVHRVSNMVAVTSLKGEQARLLQKECEQVAGSVCIVDDVNPSWTELSASRRLGTEFGVGEDVYHLLTAFHDEQAFIAALNASDTIWHGLAAVCVAPLWLGAARTSTRDSLQKCVHSVTMITCTAYDGEGFVMWRRGGELR